MKILAICDSHEAAACVMVDGEIVCAAAQERFTRLKGDMGFPDKSIDFCLQYTGFKGGDFDTIVLPSRFLNYNIIRFKREALFSTDDWLKEMYQYWQPRVYQGKEPDYVDVFKDDPKFNYGGLYDFDKVLHMEGDLNDNFFQERVRVISEYLDVPSSRISYVTHEHAHAYYAYFGSPIRSSALIFTAEGGGEYSNGTVWRADEHSGLMELSHTRENHLGHLWRFITLLLGMKPNQHEYKVMGLAPYANIKETEKVYNKICNFLDVNGMNVVVKEKPKDLYIAVRELLEGCRFDGIAGAVQQFSEEILCRWIGNVAQTEGIGKICFSGGVAQNIKACKAVSELEGLEEIIVNPIAGDGSLPIGAAYIMMNRYCEEHGVDKSVIKPLRNVYLGPSFSGPDFDRAIDRSDLKSRFRIIETPSQDWVVDSLVADKVIARISGRMEFGQRALGNRSILANPSNPHNIQKINRKIKFRDFWMPFTPTILAERAPDYIINPKKLRSPFMTMAFDSTALARDELPAALHPADYTVRPQILDRASNPEYYDLIQSFQSRTGVGGLLNTSLNLHGEPMVCSPEDAVHTFLNSDLDILLFHEHAAIVRDQKRPVEQ